MRSTGDIQFFVCRSRIIPEPPFPSQGIAGSGNEIGCALAIGSNYLKRYLILYYNIPRNTVCLTTTELVAVFQSSLHNPAALDILKYFILIYFEDSKRTATGRL